MRVFILGLFMIFILSVPVLAVEGDSIDDVVEDVASSDVSMDDSAVSVVSEDVDSASAVYIVPNDDEAFQDFSSSGISTFSVSDSISDSWPSSILFTGCWYVTGTDSRLGTITIYIPADIDPSYFGLDANGYLVYTGSTSFSAYLSSVRNNRVSFSVWSTGSYSVQSGNNYVSYDLELVPQYSNMQIQDTLLSRYSISDFFPYMVVILGGVIFVCLLKRS